MDWKKWIIIFAISFVGMCGLISVDRECQITTGEGGKLGLSVSRTATGDVAICFFGLEGEIPL